MVSFPKAKKFAAGQYWIVLVDVLVEEGRLGVGALAEDGQTFFSEQEVGPEDGPTTVRISNRDIADCRSITLRNLGADRRRSVAIVESLRTYRSEGPITTNAMPSAARRDCFADLSRMAGKVGTIIDIGANVGDTVAKCRTFFPSAQVHAVEPTPELVQQLKGRFDGDPSVVIHEFAVSDRLGTVQFHRNESHVTSSLLRWAQDAGSFVEGSLRRERIITVDSVTLDEFCARQGLERIDLLKVDVQGAEKLVLEGARNLFKSGKVRFVLLEASFVPIYTEQTEFEEILSVMRELGFVLFNLYDLRHTDAGRIKWGDALFHRPDDQP